MFSDDAEIVSLIKDDDAEYRGDWCQKNYLLINQCKENQEGGGRFLQTPVLLSPR